MYGRRRRTPLLGAAVVLGTSRSVARREVDKREQLNADLQMRADQRAEEKRREDEERDKRTQLAIEQAIAKERLSAAQTVGTVSASPSISGRNDTVNEAAQAPLYNRYEQGVGDKQGGNINYCRNCGQACERADKFCRKCGSKQSIDEGIGPGGVAGDRSFQQ